MRRIQLAGHLGERAGELSPGGGGFDPGLGKGAAGGVNRPQDVGGFTPPVRARSNPGGQGLVAGVHPGDHRPHIVETGPAKLAGHESAERLPGRERQERQCLEATTLADRGGDPARPLLVDSDQKARQPPAHSPHVPPGRVRPRDPVLESVHVVGGEITKAERGRAGPGPFVDRPGQMAERLHGLLDRRRRLEASARPAQGHETPAQVAQHLTAGENLGLLAVGAGLGLRDGIAAVGPTREGGRHYYRSDVGHARPEGQSPAARPKHPARSPAAPSTTPTSAAYSR